MEDDNYIILNAKDKIIERLSTELKSKDKIIELLLLKISLLEHKPLQQVASGQLKFKL